MAGKVAIKREEIGAVVISALSSPYVLPFGIQIDFRCWKTVRMTEKEVFWKGLELGKTGMTPISWDVACMRVKLEGGGTKSVVPTTNLALDEESGRAAS